MHAWTERRRLLTGFFKRIDRKRNLWYSIFIIVERRTPKCENVYHYKFHNNHVTGSSMFPVSLLWTLSIRCDPNLLRHNGACTVHKNVDGICFYRPLV